MSKYIAPAMSKKDIEGCANSIRKCLGMENELYIPVMKVIELGIQRIDESFSYDIVSFEELEYNEYAKYYPLKNLMKIREDVYDAVCEDDGRHRFTLAHELGHYFLHGEDVSFSRCSEYINIPKYRDPEWQANAFASAFLMPAYLIGNMSASEVSAVCKTSYEASSIALRNAKRASCN